MNQEVVGNREDLGSTDRDRWTELVLFVHSDGVSLGAQDGVPLGEGS